jgi:deazaflavin-dependent oxidoreductase (nitroreductase family)
VPGIDPPFCYVRTTGRRTGRPHTIEIWFGRAGTTLYVLAGGRERADWVRNLLADPAVTVRVGDDDEVEAVARVLEAGTEEDALARRLVLDKYQRPGSSELEGWGLSALAVAFDRHGVEPPSPG